MTMIKYERIILNKKEIYYIYDFGKYKYQKFNLDINNDSWIKSIDQDLIAKDINKLIKELYDLGFEKVDVNIEMNQNSKKKNKKRSNEIELKLI